MDATRDDVTDEAFRLAGLSGDEHVLTPAGRSLRMRLPWLGVKLATALVGAWVIGLFRATIVVAVGLAVYMPVVSAMCGNAATQTLAVIVRGIALGELTGASAWQALKKELLVALGNGAAAGGAAAIVVGVATRDWPLAGILWLAMVLDMFIAATAGTLIPLGLKALKVDPAHASTVLITTFTDVFGFLSFLGLGTIFLKFLHR